MDAHPLSFCQRSGNGGSQTCLPAACGVAQGVAQYVPSTSNMLKTLARGQASWDGRQEASSGMASSGWLTRRRRDQGGVPHEVPVTQAMTTEARRAPACAESLFPLWCKGGKRRREYQAKATISVQQDEDQQSGRMEVIMEPRKASSSESLAGQDQL